MAATVFSTQLQTLRKARGIKQEQLADYLGVSAQAVSKWENGSYPDGDLLPRIADYFDVSIDYLYGRENEKVGIEQQLMDELKEAAGDKELFEQMRKLLWAMQIAQWEPAFRDYTGRVSEVKNEAASSLCTDSGFTQMRLNRDLEYYVWMKEPKEGFASHFKVTGELAELLRCLGEEDTLKVLFYMMTLSWKDVVRVTALEKRLGVPKEKIKRILELLNSSPNGAMIIRTELVDEDDRTEDAYGIDPGKAPFFFMLLAAAEGMLNPPNYYYYQNFSRSSNRPWFDRTTLFPKH
ncbi:MAG: helix-turn-helix domain-containing protein [Lachnospiraceae bacterium]